MPVTDTWTLDASGSWATGTNWSLSTAPNAANDAVVAPGSGTAPFLVSYNQTGSVASLGGVAIATLDIAGGQLTIASPTNGASLPASWAGTVIAAAGTIELAAGWTISGAATLGASAAFEIDSGVLFLMGTQSLDGTILGPGFLSQAGTAEAGGLALGNALVAVFNGTVDQDGTVTIGSTGAADATTLDVSGEGSWNIQTDTGIGGGAGGTLQNDGLLTKTGGTGLSLLSGGSLISDGTIVAATGTIGFAALNNLIGGELDGTGFAVEAGASATLQAGLALNAAALELQAGSATVLAGDLAFAGAFRLDTAAALALSSNLTLSGSGLLAGTVSGTGGGQITTNGTTDIAGLSGTGGLKLLVGKLATQDGGFSLVGKLQINSGGSYDLLGDVGLAAPGTLSIANAGLFEKTGGTGISQLAGTFATTGTLAVASGTVALTGAAATLGGTVSGAGVLSLGGTGTVALASGLRLSVATLDVIGQGSGLALQLQGNVAYGGQFVAPVADAIGLGGHTLTLSGQATIGGGGAAARFAGGGSLLIGAGGQANLATATFAGGVTLENAALLIASGALTLDADAAAAASVLTNDAGGTLVLAGTLSTGGGAGTLVNAGVLVTSYGAGASSIATFAAINSGTIFAGGPGIAIAPALSGNGTLVVAASLVALGGGSSNVVAFSAAGETLALGAGGSLTGLIGGFALGDTLDLAGITAPVVAYSGSATGGVLSVGADSFTLGGNFAGLNFHAASDGSGGTDVWASTAAGGISGSSGSGGGASGTLPDVSGSFTAAIAGEIASVLAALQPSGGAVNVATLSGGALGGGSVAGALNALVVAATPDGTTEVLPAGFAAGYQIGGAATLRDAAGGVALIATAANAALIGAPGDTLFGGNANATLSATTGAETLIGGTGSNAFVLGASTAQVTSQGNDTITGSSGAETVNASGSALYFGTSGATNFTATGSGGDTIIGGTNGNTVQGGGGAQLIFGSSNLAYYGGAGAATVIGGGGFNEMVGGAGNLLIFASSNLVFTGLTGAATIIGGGAPINVTIGAGGGLVYGSPGGSDTLVAYAGDGILVGGGNGDVLSASASGNDTLIAGPGAETLSGAFATGNLVLFGGPGNDTLVGGSANNLFIAESGNETLVGGGSSDSYVFVATPGTTRTDVIAGFNPTVDAIGLFGYGAEPGADAAALASANVVGGNTVVSLTDGTSIIFVGTPALHSYNFF